MDVRRDQSGHHVQLDGAAAPVRTSAPAMVCKPQVTTERKNSRAHVPRIAERGGHTLLPPQEALINHSCCDQGVVSEAGIVPRTDAIFSTGLA